MRAAFVVLILLIVAVAAVALWLMCFPGSGKMSWVAGSELSEEGTNTINVSIGPLRDSGRERLLVEQLKPGWSITIRRERGKIVTETYVPAGDKKPTHLSVEDVP